MHLFGDLLLLHSCVMVIDALPSLPGYGAFFHIANTRLFWLCLIGITVAAMLPRFVVKVSTQDCIPSDIQIAREEEKFGNSKESGAAEIEMNQNFDPPQTEIGAFSPL